MNINVQQLAKKSTNVSNRNALDQELSNIILTSKISKVINHLIGAGYRLDSIQFSHETISKDTSTSISTVKRAIGLMVSLGLCTTITREWNTCIITINKSIYELAHKFKHKFYHLKRVARDNLQRLSLPNELPLRDIFISKPCRYMYQLLETTKGVYSRGMTLLNRFKRRGIEVDDVGALKISVTLRDITEKLRLSRLGQIKLMAFDDDALRVVWGSYKSTKNVKSPFDWMVVACEQYCIVNKIPVDWQIYYALLKRYNVQDNKVYVRKSEHKSEPTKTLQVDQSTHSRPEPKWKSFVGLGVAQGFEHFDEQRSMNLSS